LPNKISKKDFEKIFEKANKQKVELSKNKVQNWIKEFVNEIDRINQFFIGKENELI
jgi:molecular chaperone GrpE (heat shock protein)